MNTNKTFAKLFKKYRLRSEFETLKELADTLAEEGFIYEESIFSHWQKGTKTPKNRALVLILIKIFTARGGIVTLEQANELLESVDQGYLTNSEIYSFPSKFKVLAPFQAPKEPLLFTGRDEQLETLKMTLLDHQIVLLYGAAGRGKTTLAIKIAHSLKDYFPDGVLWFRLGSASVSNILTSIAYTYGEDISRIKDDSVKASIVRSIVNEKKFLLVYDNLTSEYDLDLLIPNSGACSVLITSTNNIENVGVQKSMYLPPFSKEECVSLYRAILSRQFVIENKKKLVHLTDLVGQSPLAVTITARLLKQNVITLEELEGQIKNEEFELSRFAYENKTLAAVLHINYESLTAEQKRILQSLIIFISGNFSTEAVSFINKVSLSKAKLLLSELASLSFIEQLANERWQIHPLIRIFVKEKFANTKLYSAAASYYVKFLKKIFHQRSGYQILMATAADNAIHIFEKCLELKYHEQAIQLWKYLSSYLWDTGSWNSLHTFTKKIFKITEKLGDYPNQVLCYIKEFSMLYYWQGDVERAERVTLAGLKLAEKVKDPYLIAFAKERLGKIYLNRNRTKEAEVLLHDSLDYFLKVQDNEQIANSLRILGECKIVAKENDQAKQFMLDALKYYKKLKLTSLKYIYEGIVYYYLGGVYFEKNSPKALDYFKMSLESLQEGGDQSGEKVWAYIAVGLYYEYEGNMVLARESYINAKKALLHLENNKIIENKVILFYLLNSRLQRSILFKQLVDS